MSISGHRARYRHKAGGVCLPVLLLSAKLVCYVWVSHCAPSGPSDHLVIKGMLEQTLSQN